MLPLLSASTFRFRYGSTSEPDSSRYTSKRSPVRSATGWSLSPPLLSSTLAPAAAAPGAPVSNRNAPSPSGTSAGPVTNPGRTVLVVNFTDQPCNAPGRTTTSVVAAFAVPGLITPVQAAATASAVTSPESRRNRMVDSNRDGAIRHDLMT